MEAISTHAKKAVRKRRAHFYTALGHVFVISLAALAIGQIKWITAAAISPLIIGTLIGIVVGPYYHKRKRMAKGINYAAKQLLRLGIILFGFRVSVNGIASLGIHGVLMGVIVVAGIFLLGTWLGKKVFKLDSETSMLVSCGSAVCGAAAVLALESTLRSAPTKSSIAVGTVIVFGILSMFLYPIVYRFGWVPFNHYWEGFYVGGTLHEVAMVVGAGSAIAPTTLKVGVVVKMIRVILLVPLLFGVSLFGMKGKGGKITVPWFALGFLACIGLNYYIPFPHVIQQIITWVDTLLLTMAMTALGLEMKWSKFKEAGGKSFALAGVLWVVLIIGGAFLVWGISHL
ncbi:YeiH family protein [Microbacter margulisiae]|uniref:Putative integral membrane protein (TIGR00698 family) n=1 Tax=Microbacter margulisiae TaxID=1350067 RepID=A0A7W5DRG6_9PORP|nr:YeiH family protein [Microbacter margulisiae]MBB3187691.1 putative integral membrane protein (TIGR00698 family) [Microbacter margulisiae]